MRAALPSDVLSAPRRFVARVGVSLLAYAAFPLLVFHVAWFVASLDATAWLTVPLGAIAGLVVLDGITGCVHWACDTWGDERTRLVGPGLVRSFREHHVHPRAMLEHPWLDVNRETLIATTIVMSVLLMTPLRESLVRAPFWAAALYATFGLGCISNQLHYWAHADDPPPIVRRLQFWGLLLSPETHARHHRPPRTDGYCIATGWLNPLLDTTGAWRALERIVTRASGARPRAQSPDPT